MENRFLTQHLAATPATALSPEQSAANQGIFTSSYVQVQLACPLSDGYLRCEGLLPALPIAVDLREDISTHGTFQTVNRQAPELDF